MNDHQANTIFEQSIAQLKKGDAKEALKLLGTLDKAIPSNPGILYFTAAAHSILGNKLKAIQIYERVLRLNPQFIEAYNNIALDLAYLGEHEKAIFYFEQALAIRPDFTEAVINKGASFNELGMFPAAISAFEFVLRTDPKNTLALANLTITYIRLGDLDFAENVAKRALEANQRDLSALQNLGNIYLKRELPDTAIGFFLSALNIKENDTDSIAGLASAHLDKKNYTEAEKLFNLVLAKNPEHGETYKNLGILYHELRRFEDALNLFSAPIKNKKRVANREYNRALTFLHAGKLTEGWRDYEWRWRESELPVTQLKTTRPVWRGLPTEKTIFIWHEQGIGDQVLFGTLINETTESAPNLIIRLDARLIPVFQNTFPKIRFISAEETLKDEDFEFHIPIGNLGSLFRNTLNSFEKQTTSYLKAGQQRQEEIQPLLSKEKLNVGIAWFTKGRRSEDRNLPLSDLVSAIQSEYLVNLIDLQYSNTSNDRTSLKEQEGIVIWHIAEVDNDNDLEGLTALINLCDLVVTCSNSTAHLAGALGKETYLLVPYGRGRHWYWSHIGKNGRSLWYPSVRVLPQIVAGSWREPLQELSEALKKRG